MLFQNKNEAVWWLLSCLFISHYINSIFYHPCTPKNWVQRVTSANARHPHTQYIVKVLFVFEKHARMASTTPAHVYKQYTCMWVVKGHRASCSRVNVYNRGVQKHIWENNTHNTIHTPDQKNWCKGWCVRAYKNEKLTIERVLYPVESSCI